MHVKFVTRESVRKTEFGNIKSGTVFRKVELVGGIYVIVDPDMFFLKVDNSPSITLKSEGSNAVSLCEGRATKSRFDVDEFIQDYDDTVLTIKSIE